MEKTIYDLELHEELYINDDRFIMRVPGGWIYEQRANGDGDDYGARTSITFVPFNNEFIQGQ